MKKSELRTDYLSRRKSLSRNDFRQFAQSISEGLVRLALRARPGIVHSYLPIAKQNEFDPRPFIKELRERQPSLKVAAPRIVAGKNELAHFFVDDRTELQTSHMGIAEPVDSNPVNESKLDLVVVPLICFDQKGHRVGYGGGYYDRFLAQCRPDCVKVGVSFFEPVEEIEGIHEGDVRLDYCVTPEMVYNFGER